MRRTTRADSITVKTTRLFHRIFVFSFSPYFCFNIRPTHSMQFTQIQNARFTIIYLSAQLPYDVTLLKHIFHRSTTHHCSAFAYNVSAERCVTSLHALVAHTFFSLKYYFTIRSQYKPIRNVYRSLRDDNSEVAILRWNCEIKFVVECRMVHSAK